MNDYNPKEAVFTSTQVLNENMPILYVIHDNDNSWQFLSGFEKGRTEEGKVIALEEVFKIDSLLRNLVSMKAGTEAHRKDINSEWVISVLT